MYKYKKNKMNYRFNTYFRSCRNSFLNFFKNRMSTKPLALYGSLL